MQDQKAPVRKRVEHRAFLTERFQVIVLVGEIPSVWIGSLSY